MRRNTHKKTWFNKLNNSILKKKTPLLGFTVLQLFILFVVINGGTVAVILSQRQQPVANDTRTNLPSYEANTEEPTKTVDTAPQDATQSSSNTQSAPTSSKPTTSTNLPDQYGCIPQSSGYESCVTYAKKNALSAWCSEQSRSASAIFNPEANRAKAAYDVVMAEWNAVKDLPYYQRHPYEQYAADAKTKYNVIFKPAYATYVNKINSLNTQGCNEIVVYSDTSWAGY